MFVAHANPWIFQEIKPLNEAETVKKSNIPDKPVKDIDPTKPTIHIKQDIREDILGKNTSSTKFKEGVKKLLDFLEEGPKAIGDAPDKETTSPLAPSSQNPKGNEAHAADKDNSIKDIQMLKQNNESLSYKQDKQSDFSQVNGMNSKDLNTVANGDHDDKTQKEPNTNFVNQLKEPPAIPMRSEINRNGMLHDGTMDNNLQSAATGDHLSSFNKDSHDDKTQKESNSNLVNQLKEPPAIPMRSEINGNGVLNDGMVDKNLQSIATGDHLISFNKDNHDDKPMRESNANFANQQKEPPAIPMRSQINSNGMLPVHATVALLPNGMRYKAGFGGNQVARSQIPYKMPYQATQLLQNNAIVRSNYKTPNPVSLPNLQYNPYSALYQRSSFPHHYGNYGVALRPISMATQAYRYPYNQRRMLPLKPNSFNPALRTNLRLPFYKNAALRSHVYNPRLRFPYTKTLVPQRPAMIPQRAPMSIFPAKSNIPNFRNFQIPQPHHAYPVLPKWNLLGRNTILKPALRPRGIKYRRLATNDRGHSYSGLSSPRDKVTQKSPLPLPLASIMTVARIVVPARPHTLNGAFKSNVETMSSADPEEKGARAV